MRTQQQLVSNLNVEGLSVNRLQWLHQEMLAWYALNHRTLPWRATHGKHPNPYYVLISEIMLQQTTVPTVKKYFSKFINRWPTIQSLANASEEELLVMWQGLGYYRRARLLLKCAQSIANLGMWPEKSSKLIKLPGIGDYTASAISAIAFNEDVIPLDGNIIRVLARFAGLLSTKEQAKKLIQRSLAQFKGFSHAGDFCQALMDLGSAICKPSNPQCNECPLNSLCIGFQKNIAKFIPQKVEKFKKRLFTNAYCIMQNDKIFLQKNTTTALLKNMMLVPMDSWQEIPKKANLLDFNWIEINKSLRHIFTHIDLNIHVHWLNIKNEKITIKGEWVEIKNLENWPLPTLTKKIIQIVFKQKGC